MANKDFRISIKTLIDNGMEKVAAGVEKVIGKLSQMKDHATSAFSAIKKGVDLALAPLKVFTTVLAGGGGLFAAFAASSIKSAAAMETLRAQMMAVMATKAEADKAFAESIDFSVRTPFEPSEIIATRIALEGVGITGQAAVESVASAAAALNRNILDVASAVRSMETEPLRNLGIMLKRDGDKFVIEYKDKMRQAREISVTGFAAAQQALLEVMIQKFDGGLDAMSQTFDGKLSTLKGAFDKFKADFGEEFLPSVKRIIDDLIGVFTGNSLKDFGAKLNEHIEAARIKVIATFQTAGEISAIIRDNLARGGDGLGKILNSIFINAVDSMFKAMIAGLKSSIEIWKLIGRVVGSSIKEELLKLDIPGIGGLRKKTAEAAIDTADKDTLIRALEAIDVVRKGEPQEWLNESGGNLESLRTPLRAITRTKESDAILAASTAGEATTDSFAKFETELKEAMSEFGDGLSQNIDNLSEAISVATGKPMDIEQTYARFVAQGEKTRSQEIEQERSKAAQREMVPTPVQSTPAAPAPLPEPVAPIARPRPAEGSRLMDEYQSSAFRSPIGRRATGESADPFAEQPSAPAINESMLGKLPKAAQDGSAKVVAAIGQMSQSIQNGSASQADAMQVIIQQLNAQNQQIATLKSQIRNMRK